MLCWSFTCHDVHHHEEAYPLWYFLFKNTNHEPNKPCTWHEPWLICKTYQFITLQGNIYFQFVPVHINYFVRLKKMFGTWRNIFSTLNLAMIFIKSFTCKIAHFLPFLNETLFLHLTFTYIKTDWQDWLTDTAGIHGFIRNIPSKIRLSPITLWQVILTFMLSVLSTQEIKFWLITRLIQH